MALYEQRPLHRWLAVQNIYPLGIATLKAASTPWTTSGLEALGDKVSILKDWFLWSTANGRRLAENNYESEPRAQRTSTVMESPPLIRVKELVNKLADPRLPLLI